MNFRTRIDFTNRQAKQYEKTDISLSGTSVFGLPYSALTSGPNLSVTGITFEDAVLQSTYSGNTGTTVYTFGDSRMTIDEGNLSALTPSNSATTQYAGPTWAGYNMFTTTDGYTGWTSYSAVTYDLNVISMIDLGGGAYSGIVESDFIVYSGDSLDYTGRTIWVDVSGITRTNDLIITNNPQIGYVWTCIDAEGKGSWVPNSSADTNTYTTGSTLINDIAYFDTNTSLSAYTLNLTSLSGSPTYWSASTGTNAIVTKNSNHLVTGNRSVALGGQNITGATDDTVYVPNLNVRDDLGIGIEPQYKFHAFNNDSHLIYDSSNLTSVSNLLLSGNTSGLTQMAVVEEGSTTSISIGVRGSGDTLYTGYGKVNDSFVYVGFQSNGLNFQTAENGGYPDKEHYFRFFAGQTANGTTPDLHIQGSGSTRGYVGIGVTGVTQQLDVENNARFRNIGSSASAGALHYTADGTLTTNTSDYRLKTNIQPVNNALDKILNLRGVYYNWVEDISGDTRLGFIAQEVNSVVPELAFTNERSQEKYMGVHYDNVTALLVEGFKELVSGNTKIINTNIETQTIASEDNNIDLNYGGNHTSALGGGIRVLNGVTDGVDSEIKIDKNGRWIVTPSLTTTQLSIPEYTPTSTNDDIGDIGDIVWDNDYIYIKRNNGWGRTKLENF